MDAKPILFIDDDEDFLYLMKRVCKKIHLISDVYTVKNGVEAVHFFEELLGSSGELPSLAFIDINMPVMNGFEFVEEFKKMRAKFVELESVTPVAMLTSSDNERDKEKAFSTGIITDYIVKPKDFRQMNETISDLMVR